MTTVLPLSSATIALADLQTMMGCSDSVLRRRLRKQGIPPTGHRVPLALLRSHWRVVYDSWLILHDPQIGCPACGMPTQRACTACDFVAA